MCCSLSCLRLLLVLGWKANLFIFRFLLLGLIITIAPWLIHNYLQTGELALDASFQYSVLASQYAYTGNLNLHYDFTDRSLGRVLIDFVLQDPAFVFGFIINHFLAAQVNGLLALPLLKPYNGIFEPLNLYWINWDGRLEWYNFLLIIVYLVIIALGLGSAWRRWHWIGLLPLGFSFGYALATAIGRFSGWRYDLPADWVWYFYFGIGIAELLLQVTLLFGMGDSWSSGTERAYRDLREQLPVFPQLLVFTALFALIGALPWLAEGIASPRYSDQSPNFLEQKMVSVPNTLAREEIDAFLSRPESFLQTGKLLYPRFLSKNNRISSASPLASHTRHVDYPRIGFLL
jgi:hypothetical protein